MSDPPGSTPQADIQKKKYHLLIVHDIVLIADIFDKTPCDKKKLYKKWLIPEYNEW